MVLLVVVTGCGVNKRVAYEEAAKATPKPSQRTDVPYVEEATEVYETRSLPADTGRFVKFPIANTEEYIALFAAIAQSEMQVYGIPASITLAQGILESGAGNGDLTLRTNNHFGIKCHVGWEGAFDFHDDDTQGECFRKYNHPLHSFRDHSIFLSTRNRYKFLFSYPKDDYKRWAHGLWKAGYATDRKYPQKLISLIERYRLDLYDQEVLSHQQEVKHKPKKYTKEAYVVQKGDTLYAISKKYALSVEEIMQLNKLNSTQLSVGQVLKVWKERSN